jgi:hypothetical protein
MYKRGPPMYTIEIFEQVGKALLISILDLFEKNPYTRYFFITINIYLKHF